MQDIFIRSNQRSVVMLRQAVACIPRKHTLMSFPEAGQMFGKHHACVINNEACMRSLMVSNPGARLMMERSGLPLPADLSG